MNRRASPAGPSDLSYSGLCCAQSLPSPLPPAPESLVALFVESGPYRGVFGLVVFANAPGVIGPVFGGILWAIKRRGNRPFAVGAVAFGVAAFLFVGGCLTLMGI